MSDDRRNSGFSLLETLIALGFLAMASLAVVATFLFASRLDNTKETRHQVALIAVDAMETARAALIEDFQADVSLDRHKIAEAPIYEVKRSQAWIGQSAGADPGALKEVTVIVSWRDPQGAQTYPLIERFARPR